MKDMDQGVLVNKQKIGMVGAWLLLAACRSVPAAVQPPQPLAVESAPATEAAAVSRSDVPQALINGRKPTAVFYFDRNLKRQAAPVADGFYRYSYGRQPNGLYLVQDFYQDSRTKQTGPLYVADEQSADSSYTVGRAVWYNRQGGVDYYQDIQNGKIAVSGLYCGGILCAAYDGRNQAVIYRQGSKVMERRLQDGSAHYAVTLWYDNGRKAETYLESDDGSPVDPARRYWLPDGRPVSSEPTEPAYRQLHDYVNSVMRKMSGEEVQND